MFLNSHGLRCCELVISKYGKTSWKVTNRCRFMVGPWRAPLDYSQGCCLSWRLENLIKTPVGREGEEYFMPYGSGWGLFLVRARKWWDFDGEGFSSSQYIDILKCAYYQSCKYHIFFVWPWWPFSKIFWTSLSVFCSDFGVQNPHSAVYAGGKIARCSLTGQSQRSALKTNI